MKIKITHDAQKYIAENGQAVIVFMGKLSGCCGGAAPIPQIQLGIPEDLSCYEENIIGDITAFVDKQIDQEKQIKISFGRILWAKKLAVEVI
ncbi:MAG TPA: CC/Se motif family (seleno)protein [Patescibacteria group bacterium]|nr:CC/Se motif family (seleno)protein [Patescibacteria group bacterium]